MKVEKFAEAAKILARRAGRPQPARTASRYLLTHYLFAMLGEKRLLEGYATVPTADAKLRVPDPGRRTRRRSFRSRRTKANQRRSKSSS